MDREEIITAKIPIVYSMVNKFVSKNPNFFGVAEDLVSTGMIKLIETVDRFIAEKRDFDDHFRNYVRISIVTGIADFIRDNSIILTPKDRWTPCCSLGGGDPPAPVPVPPPLSQEAIFDDLFGYLKTENEDDYRILTAKLDGAKTAKEVAHATGLPVPFIYKRLRALRRLYQPNGPSKPDSC